MNISLLANAKILYQLYQFEELIGYCADKKEMPELRLLEARSHLALGNLDKAKKILKQYIFSGNEIIDSAAFYSLALIEFKMGRYGKTLSYLNQIKRNDSEIYHAKLLEAKTHIKLKNTDFSRSILRNIIDEDNHSINAFHLLGRIEESDKNYQESIYYFTKSCQEFGNAESYFALARIQLELNNLDLAYSLLLESSSIHESSRIKSLSSERRFGIRKSKLCHDLEQIDFIKRRRANLPSELLSYKSKIEKILELDRFKNEQMWSWIALNEYEKHSLKGHLGKSLYEEGIPSHIEATINPSVVRTHINEDFISSVYVFDNFLSEDFIESLYEHLIMSTLWHDYKYENGYLGAYMDKGLASKPLLELSKEISSFFSDKLGGVKLEHMWAFKYDSKLDGIGLHADFAQFTLNLWITPSKYNDNPDTGGLLIYDYHSAPDDSFHNYNAKISPDLEKTIRSSKQLRVPYKENRAIFFDSSLYHETDQINFQEAYEARRINLTFLFGNRND